MINTPVAPLSLEQTSEPCDSHRRLLLLYSVLRRDTGSPSGKETSRPRREGSDLWSPSLPPRSVPETCSSSTSSPTPTGGSGNQRCRLTSECKRPEACFFGRRSLCHDDDPRWSSVGPLPHRDWPWVTEGTPPRVPTGLGLGRSVWGTSTDSGKGSVRGLDVRGTGPSVGLPQVGLCSQVDRSLRGGGSKVPSQKWTCRGTLSFEKSTLVQLRLESGV